MMTEKDLKKLIDKPDISLEELIAKFIAQYKFEGKGKFSKNSTKFKEDQKKLLEVIKSYIGTINI